MVAHRALHDLAPLLLCPHFPPLPSICSAHTGCLTVPQTDQTGSRLRTLALALASSNTALPSSFHLTSACLSFRSQFPCHFPGRRLEQECPTLHSHNCLHFPSTLATLYNFIVICVTSNAWRSPPTYGNSLFKSPAHRKPLKTCVE